MEFKKLFDGTEIPVLGLGTWEMGGRYEADASRDKECIYAIKFAIDSGITHIDTARLYGNGHTEELVGEAIKSFERKKLFITTKVRPEDLRYDDVIASAKGSLKRLRTDYIDLFLIHAPNPEIPIKEPMKAMDFLIEQKIVRFIGVSNFSAKEMKEAQKYAKNSIAVNQVEYSLFVRNNSTFTENVESEILPYCQKNNIILIAFRPLSKGAIPKSANPVLDRLASKYKKTRSQIALNWLASKKSVVAIVKSSNAKHIKENLGALGWELESGDINVLDNLGGGNAKI